MQATIEFPRGVFTNDTRWITIEKSSIKNLTKDDFIGLDGLTRLEIIEGSLNEIQEGTFQRLVNLEDISLKDNQLVSFPPKAFANLTKLETVRLDKNLFEVLPDLMFENSPLKKLFLMHSKLNSTGLDSIGSGRVTTSITELHLDYTNLVRLSKAQFTGLPKLANVGLLYCNIQYIGADFLFGTKVAIVDLHGNKIVKIDADALRGSTIDSFSCQYCGLTTDEVFGKDQFLLQATSLTRINLGHNDITHIPKDAFKGLTKLETLLLFYNNISTIDENPFTVLKDLDSFGIQVNPFNCDCHLAWFHKIALDKIGKQLSGKDLLKKMTCASPSNVAGKTFPNLKTSEFCCANVCGYVGSKGATLRLTNAIIFTQTALLFLLFHV
jgi:Leucine-rich repeat (LRR) protein